MKRRTWLNLLGGGFAGNATYLGAMSWARAPHVAHCGGEKTAAIIIFLLYIASAAYITSLYLAIGGGSQVAVLIASGVAATVATSAYALAKRTDDAMWRMYKASSPALTLFLLALITNA